MKKKIELKDKQNKTNEVVEKDESMVPEIIGTTAGASIGTAGTIAAVSVSGTVSGLSAAGMASGLAAIGGSMLGGLFVVAAVPVALGIAGLCIAKQMQ